MERHTIKQNEFESHPLFARLLALHDIPEEINFAGEIPNITIDSYGRALPRILTVVGSRNHSSYGKDAIEHLIASLNGQPVIILSGLALGIDTLAHTNAIKYGLTTLSIPGSGLHPSVLYPKTNARLADEILEHKGALLSEFDPMLEAAPWTFPARNRIMAALSDAVLIIEAEEKSGTLITGRQALELGKDIGVVPGSIFSEKSKGANTLIKDGAAPIIDTDSLFELLHLERKTAEVRTLPTLTNDEKLLFELLTSPLQKDTLRLQSGLSPQNFLIAITSLELKGLIMNSLHELRRVV